MRIKRQTRSIVSNSRCCCCSCENNGSVSGAECSCCPLLSTMPQFLCLQICCFGNQINGNPGSGVDTSTGKILADLTLIDNCNYRTSSGKYSINCSSNTWTLTFNPSGSGCGDSISSVTLTQISCNPLLLKYGSLFITEGVCDVSSLEECPSCCSALSLCDCTCVCPFNSYLSSCSNSPTGSATCTQITAPTPPTLQPAPCSCTYSLCCGCPTSTIWTVTITGVSSSDVCADCVNFNRTYTFNWSAGCSWVSTFSSICSISSATLSCSGSTWTLSFGAVVTYTSSSWSCTGPNEMSLSSSNGTCIGWGATITMIDSSKAMSIVSKYVPLKRMIRFI